MSVAKMKYLNVYGPEEKLALALGAIARCECFAPESDEAIHSAIRLDINRYEPLLTKAKGLLKDLGQPTVNPPFEGDEKAYDVDTVGDFLEKFAGQVASINQRRTFLENELAVYSKTRSLLQHMTDLDVNFDELFKVGYLKVRIGRLPKTSYVRLAYYAQKKFNFTSYFNFTVYDFDGEYYWGLYFAPADSAKEIDDIFNSLYFERTRIPEFVHGRPQEALEAVSTHIQELQTSLDDLVNPQEIAADKDVEIIRGMEAWLVHMNQLFEMKKYALVFNHTFYISGFVPQQEYAGFKQKLEAVDEVKLKEADQKQELPVSPPVKLENHWFAKPYEMFTTMYGLPTYHDLDPTFLVSVIYSVLFGLMFADLGQGIVLGLFGYFYMYKKRGMAIGAVLARAGVFSALFGLLFGSVFGYEHLLDPLWRAMGLAEKPFEVMAGGSVNIILLGSISIGVVVVTAAIVTNIISKLKRGLTAPAITGSSGVAGLVFYLALIALVLDKLVLKAGFSSNIAYLALLIVLPLLVMYLQEPLNETIKTRKFHFGNPGDVLVSGFFEMFVTLLEYLSNTVSFLRVGGFVLAHAGMMSVVSTLAEMGGAAAPLVMVLGNIFVICLEGLIVGIQALRLNYYEVFSRFFDADGAPFVPLALKPDTQEL
ncbi:MAG: V-type ATP synthase subunit I [Oscillospiraceae bacterium]